jgi:hypothetical protein
MTNATALPATFNRSGAIESARSVKDIPTLRAMCATFETMAIGFEPATAAMFETCAEIVRAEIVRREVAALRRLAGSRSTVLVRRDGGASMIALTTDRGLPRYVLASPMFKAGATHDVGRDTAAYVLSEIRTGAPGAAGYTLTGSLARD